MSRGLGKLQRDLLAALDQNESAPTVRLAARGLGTDELTARALLGGKRFVSLVMQADVKSVRRALVGLERRGLVVRLGRLDGNVCRWRRRR